MNHEEAQRLLGPYVDGELDLTICLKLEEHLVVCPACRSQCAEEADTSAIIAKETPRFTPSPFLKTRIRAALREKQAPEHTWWRGFSVRWVYPSLAGAATGILLLWLGFSLLQRIPELAQEGIADHVRSLQVSHLVDVASTEDHTVKPWFAGKLDYSPPVVDLTSAGYPLIGGRLDVLDHREVAAIIYQRRKHYLNLFIWPTETRSLHGRLFTQDGYHVLGWTQSGMNYLVVSELGEKEMREFASMIQTRNSDSRLGE